MNFFGGKNPVTLPVWLVITRNAAKLLCQRLLQQK